MHIIPLRSLLTAMLCVSLFSISLGSSVYVLVSNCLSSQVRADFLKTVEGYAGLVEDYGGLMQG